MTDPKEARRELDLDDLTATIYRRLSLGVGASLLAATLGGTSLYSSRDALSSTDADRIEARLTREIDEVQRELNRHRDNHPNVLLEERIRHLEKEHAALRTEVRLLTQRERERHQ